MKRAILILALLACGGSADSGCPQSAYELEGHYRCTAAGELQTLSCGAWETLVECGSGAACSPGPEMGCRTAAACPEEGAGWTCDAGCQVCSCDGLVRAPEGSGRGECLPRP